MPDSTIHVLSTRALSPELITGAAEKGITIDVNPFIKTEPVAPALLQQRIGDLGERRLVAVFTSTSAVEAVAAYTGGTKLWTVFCIGTATRQSVSRYFGEEAIASTAESALALAKKIISQGGKAEIFFFCGDQRREELPSALRGAGFRVNELVVYQTKATPHKMERSYAGVVFFSPSAVASYFSANTVGAGTTLFAIGRTTAAAIQVFCSNPMVVAEQPDAAILINQVIEHFQIKK
jgi:uroporphyrinogen-III synthase